MCYLAITYPILFNTLETIGVLVGIVFLIINLTRTNKSISLQSKALRNTTLPHFTAEVKHGALDPEIQKLELFPISIRVCRNNAYNVTFSFESNLFIDVSVTLQEYDLNCTKENKLYFENLQIGDSVLIRGKYTNKAPDTSDEFLDIEEYNNVMLMYRQKIKVEYQDLQGYSYSQEISWESVNFDKVIVHPIVFL